MSWLMRWVSVAAVTICCMVGSAASARQNASREDLVVDLVQAQLLVPKRVRIGKSFPVTDEVVNERGSLALETVTGFYLSQDAKWDEKDVLVGGRRVPQLTSQQQHNTMTLVTLTTVTPGKYFFIAVADARHRLKERFRGNNTRAVVVVVLPADQ